MADWGQSRRISFDIAQCGANSGSFGLSLPIMQRSWPNAGRDWPHLRRHWAISRERLANSGAISAEMQLTFAQSKFEYPSPDYVMRAPAPRPLVDPKPCGLRGVLNSSVATTILCYRRVESPSRLCDGGGRVEAGYGRAPRIPKRRSRRAPQLPDICRRVASGKELRPKFGEFSPSWAVFWSTLADVGQTHTRPRSDKSWPSLGQCWPHSTSFWPESAKI